MGNAADQSQQIARLGLTQPVACGYLPDKTEQLLLLTDRALSNPLNYQQLLEVGFRRSGNEIYRPHCQHCHQCMPLRLRVDDFIPSKSQQRLLKQNRAITHRVTTTASPQVYQLYERYINQVHRDGQMYPPSEEQYRSFICCEWMAPNFIEFYQEKRLIAVAVTDILADSLSAMYTFYDPTLRKMGLGIFAILKQIEVAREQNKSWLYLGYQIDQCSKMNYKTQFKPHQILINGIWENFNHKLYTK